MKKIVFVLSFLCCIILLRAQGTQLRKTDSVCVLLKKYFNEKNSDRLYALGGSDFKTAISIDAFKNICNTNLFPLGEIKEIVLENFDDNVCKYKAVFSSIILSLSLSLDRDDKIKVFLFKPYVDEKAKKIDKLPSTNSRSSALDKEVDSAVAPYMSLLATAGLSIGILKDGKTIFYGYGETAKGNKQIPNEHTLFEIGSLSKTFTAILLAKAVDDGKVELDDPVNKYLPDSIPWLGYEGISVTLKTLSNHSSGIPGMPSNFHPRDVNNPYKDYHVDDLFSFYKHFKPLRKPGEKYEYSNLAVGTLGVILEGLYHKTYEELFTEYICKPLGMNETRQFLQKPDSSRFAKGYNENGGHSSQWDFDALAAAGSIRSTTSDLLRYAKANLGDAHAELNRAIQMTHSITFIEGQTKVGLCWHFITPGNDQLIFHNGQTAGFHSYLAINPSKKFAVIILSNCAIGTEKVGGSIMKWLEMDK